MQETEKSSGSGAGFPQNNPRYHVTCAAHLPSISTIQETVFYVPHGLIFSSPLTLRLLMSYIYIYIVIYIYI